MEFLNVRGGYDFALNLEEKGLWREWLGDVDHATFLAHLKSPRDWSAFMSYGLNINAVELERDLQATVTLQLRVRSLLFDRAVNGLFSQQEWDLDKLAPSEDGVYHTLEHEVDDWLQLHRAATPSLVDLQQKEISEPFLIKYGLPQPEVQTDRCAQGTAPAC
eukprot:jgi/Mesen1/3854/ME000207S02864